MQLKYFCLINYKHSLQMSDLLSHLFSYRKNYVFHWYLGQYLNNHTE